MTPAGAEGWSEWGMQATPRMSHRAASSTARHPCAFEGARVEFILATGIECSAPTILGGRRRDQLELTGHQARYAEDFAAVAGLGVRYLRYGIPFHVVARTEGRYDWTWTDRAMTALQVAGIEPIVDLMHFGVPDRLTGFGDPRLPAVFTDYAAAFADRFPWVRWYTPVNEPFISALFSARYGWWNEQGTTDAAFVQAMANTATCAIEGMRVIRQRRSDARFLQSDACESYLAATAGPWARRAADALQERSWLGFDLTYGHPVSPRMRRWLLGAGLAPERLVWLEQHGTSDGCVIGLDYYEGNEHVVGADGEPSPAVRRGLGALAREVHDRYGLPFMLAETNNVTERAVPWLTETWNDILELRAEGLPAIGYCWYSLTDQIDWDTCMREANDRVNTLGLVDLDRVVRPVGSVYAGLAADVAAGELRPLPTEEGLAA